jgi:hypothetical protein
VGIFWDWQERGADNVNACKEGQAKKTGKSGKADKRVETELDEHTCKEERTDARISRVINKLE